MEKLAIFLSALVALGGCTSTGLRRCDELAIDPDWARSQPPVNSQELLALTTPLAPGTRQAWYSNTNGHFRVCDYDEWSDVLYEFTKVDGAWRAKVSGLSWRE